MRPRTVYELLLALWLAAPGSWTAAADSEPGPEAESPLAAQTQAAAATATAADAVAKVKELLRENNVDEALATAEKALQQFPDQPDLLLAKGAVERRKGDNLAAVVTYERLLTIRPTEPAVAPILTLLLCELATQSDDKKALLLLKRALQLSPDDQPTRLTYCLAAVRLGQAAELCAAYEGLDAESKKRPDLLRAAANGYLAQQNFVRAAALFGALLDTAPGDRATVDAFVQSASHLPPEAMRTSLGNAALRHPNNTNLLRATAQIALEQKDIWTGLQMLSRVLKLDPADAEAARMKTALLAELGCYSLARECLEAHADSFDAATTARVRARADEARAQWATLDATLENSAGPTSLLVIAYGDVQLTTVPGQPSVSMTDLVQELEYLHGHDFRFLSTRDVLTAQRRRTALPKRAVLILVQGGYASFAERVLPLLEQYACPVVLALPTGLLEGETKPASAAPLMTWPQIRLATRHPLVTLASQTHALGAFVPCNPQGRTSLSATTRIYSPQSATYESTQTFRDRVALDLKTSRRVLEARVQQITDLLMWPEGAFNAITLAEAQALDFNLMFAPWSPTLPNRPGIQPTLTVAPGTSLETFARQVAQWGTPAPPAHHVVKSMPLDLAALATDTPAVTRANLAAAVERAVSLDLSRVYLSACADTNADGVADAALFPNRVLPVKTDILNHAVGLLKDRGLEVVVTMPTLGIQLPEKDTDPEMQVMTYRWGRIIPSAPPQQRLSPFNPSACRRIVALHEDLAAYVDFDGVLLGPDAFLAESEDAGLAAAKLFRDRAGIRERNPGVLAPELLQTRLNLKIEVLNALLDELYRTVKQMRPQASCARAIAGPVVMDADARAQYAQDYRQALERFDGIWVDATPERYAIPNPTAWIQALASAVAAQPGAREKTTFAVGLQATAGNAWLSRGEWADRVRDIVERGGRQITYYPDEGPGDGLPKPKTVLKVYQVADDASRAAPE